MRRTTSNLPPGNRGSSSVQGVVITAITLFALAGLMVGFAFGAINRPRSTDNPPIANNEETPLPTVTQTVSPTPEPTPSGNEKVELGCPQVSINTLTLIPDNTTPYTFTVQAKDKTGYTPNENCSLEKGKPVLADGISCRLWLMKGSDNTSDISTYINNAPRPLDLSKPFPHEQQNFLTFNATEQVQISKQGMVSWNFTIPPSAQPGEYKLIALTYWEQHYNFNWAEVTIKK